MDNQELIRLSRAVHDRDVNEYEQRFAQERAACLTPSRARALVLNDSRWTEPERDHVASCSHCDRMLKLYEEKVAHPSSWLLARRALGLLRQDENAAVEDHLQQDACQLCRERCERIDSVPSRLRECVVAFSEPIRLRNPEAAQFGDKVPNKTDDWLSISLPVSDCPYLVQTSSTRKAQNRKTEASQLAPFRDSSDDAATSRPDGDSLSVDDLRQIVPALNDSDPEARRQAVEAIGEIGLATATHDVLTKLTALMDDEHTGVRNAVVETLAKLGQSANTDAIIGRLCDLANQADSRLAAVRALAAIADERRWRLLRRGFVQQGLEVEFLDREQDGEVLVEIRTKEPTCCEHLFLCGFQGPAARAPDLHFFLLQPDAEDWYHKILRFPAQELFNQLGEKCEDLLVYPVDVNGLASDEKEALLKSVSRDCDRNDQPAIAAWKTWAEQPWPREQTRKLMTKVRKLLPD